MLSCRGRSLLTFSTIPDIIQKTNLHLSLRIPNTSHAEWSICVKVREKKKDAINISWSFELPQGTQLDPAAIVSAEHIHSFLVECIEPIEHQQVEENLEPNIRKSCSKKAICLGPNLDDIGTVLRLREGEPTMLEMHSRKSDWEIPLSQISHKSTFQIIYGSESRRASVRNLKADSKYTIRVYARNNIGTSEVYGSIEATTLNRDGHPPRRDPQSENDRDGGKEGEEEGGKKGEEEGEEEEEGKGTDNNGEHWHDIEDSDFSMQFRDVISSYFGNELDFINFVYLRPIAPRTCEEDFLPKSGDPGKHGESAVLVTGISAYETSYHWLESFSFSGFSMSRRLCTSNTQFEEPWHYTRGFLAFMDLLSGDLQLDFDDARRPRIYASEVEVDEGKKSIHHEDIREGDCVEVFSKSDRQWLPAKTLRIQYAYPRGPIQALVVAPLKDRDARIRVAPGYFRYEYGHDTDIPTWRCHSSGCCYLNDARATQCLNCFAENPRPESRGVLKCERLQLRYGVNWRKVSLPDLHYAHLHLLNTICRMVI